MLLSLQYHWSDQKTFNEPPYSTAVSSLVSRIKNEQAPPEYAFLKTPFLDNINAIKTLAQTLKLHCSHLLVLGTGGSALGAQALIEKTPEQSAVSIIQTMDESDLRAQLAKLNPHKTAVHLVSKSGHTLETWCQWQIVETWLKQHLSLKEYAKQVVVSTDDTTTLFDILAHESNFQKLSIPSAIGGRFSVFTSCGLLAAAFSGADLDALKTGATYTLDSFLNAPSLHLATALGCRLWQAHQAGQNMAVLWCYASWLRSIGVWFQQLWAESLGKACHVDGRLTDMPTGSTPLVCLGPQDQHSLLQLFLEGPKDKCFLILAHQQHTPQVQSLKLDHLIPGAHTPLYLSDIVWAQANATYASIVAAQRPVGFINVSDKKNSLDHQKAALLMSFMLATLLGAELYQVNPFGQAGVELGKQLTKALLAPNQTSPFQSYLNHIPPHMQFISHVQKD